jgi:hypothetical protein
MKNLIKYIWGLFWQLILKLWRLFKGNHPFNRVFSYNWLYVRLNVKWYKKNLDLFKEKIVIDYGAGNCPYYPIIKNSCKKYIALDFYDSKLPSMAGLSRVNLHDDGTIPDEWRSQADVIVSNQVVPEIDDPVTYFSQINKISKIGTKLFLTTSFFQTLGLNDKMRLSPFYINSQLKKHGYEIVVYQPGAFFLAGVAFSLAMLLTLKNKYDYNSSKAKQSVWREVFWAPIIMIVNVFGWCFDKLLPFSNFPAHYLIIAQKIK